MIVYPRILLAVDLSDESDQLIAKACNIATNNDAELSVIHVIEPLSFAYGGDVPMDYQPPKTNYQNTPLETSPNFATNSTILLPNN